MLKMEVKTKLSQEEAIKRAVDFFGPGGCGLEIKNQGLACVSFEGGGGIVEVVACTEEKGTSVELVSREWDQAVRAFVNKIG